LNILLWRVVVVVLLVVVAQAVLVLEVGYL
jgi:hypothetical protein